MAWAGQTWMRLYKETTYGTFDGAGATLYPRLYQGNSFTVREVPQRQIIRTADAGNRPIMEVSNRLVLVGTLNTLLFPTQAPYWATALTLASNNVPSYSATFWDSIRAYKLLGGKIARFAITANAQQDYASLSIDWIFQSNDDAFTVYTEPAQSVFPPEDPYCHVESKAQMLLGGAALTLYKNMNVNVANVLVPAWNEDTVISSLYYCGRDATFNYNREYTAVTARAAFKAQTPLTYVLKWTRAAQHLTFTCQATSYITNLTDDLPLDGPGYQSADVQPFYDITATTDLTITSA